MRIMHIWRPAFAMLVAFSLASCSSESLDGDWDPMKWDKTDYEVIKEDGTKYYNVPQEGQTFTFTCKNYRPWIDGVKVTIGDKSDYVHPDDVHSLDYESMHVKVEDRNVTVSFEPNQAGEQTHCYDLTVTAGDIFDTFSFKQSSSGVLGYCQIRYSFFGASQDLLDFYDITAEYLDTSGQQQTKVIEEKQWLYEPESLSITDAPEEFKCRIVAKRKTKLLELTDGSYEIGYGISSQVGFFNAKGDEIERAKHTQPSSFTWETDRAGMLAFLNSTLEIEIENFSFKCDKSDIIERLK